MTDIWFAFETLQHDHDVDVLMAYGRCLRPALYSSLRSSPSHPTGVSALRVTIAIANARVARQTVWLRKSTAKSRRLFQGIGYQPTCSGRRYWRIHRNDPNCILSQIAATTQSLLAWKLGAGNLRTGERESKIKALAPDAGPSRCLHIQDLAPSRRAMSPTQTYRYVGTA